MNTERRDAWLRLLGDKSAEELAELVDAMNLLRMQGAPVPLLACLPAEDVAKIHEAFLPRKRDLADLARHLRALLTGEGEGRRELVGLLSAVGRLWDWRGEGLSIFRDTPKDGLGDAEIIERLQSIMGTKV